MSFLWDYSKHKFFLPFVDELFLQLIKKVVWRSHQELPLNSHQNHPSKLSRFFYLLKNFARVPSGNSRGLHYTGLLQYFLLNILGFILRILQRIPLETLRITENPQVVSSGNSSGNPFKIHSGSFPRIPSAGLSC